MRRLLSLDETRLSPTRSAGIAWVRNSRCGPDRCGVLRIASGDTQTIILARTIPADDLLQDRIAPRLADAIQMW